MNTTKTVESLEQKANELRKDVIRMLTEAGSGHPGGSLSAADLITALYYEVLRLDPDQKEWEERDRFLMSKGHGCPILYAALKDRGFVEGDVPLETLRELDSPYQGHPDHRKLPALEGNTGSLGNGLSIGIGMALNARLDDRDYDSFVMLGDGECQEGQIWEAAMFAGEEEIDNLICIVDYNKIQLDGFVKDILDLEPFEEKWQSNNWHTQTIDGHDMMEILESLKMARRTTDAPSVIIAETVKGKGVSFMENNPDFHGKAPTPEQAKKALQELEENHDN